MASTIKWPVKANLLSQQYNTVNKKTGATDYTVDFWVMTLCNLVDALTCSPTRRHSHNLEDNMTHTFPIIYISANFGLFSFIQFKLCLCWVWEVQFKKKLSLSTMKANGRVDKEIGVFITSALVGSGWSASGPCHFTPGQSALEIH
jgi:hypothetical protein